MHPFGDQLFVGNSLIGARREVYPISRIGKKAKKEERWFAHAPRTLKSDAPRKADEVYHFLLPDPCMADYKKAIVEPLAPEQFEKLKNWQKDFFLPLDSEEIAQAKRLSAVIDDLFEENARALAKERKENTDPLPVWGQPAEGGVTTDFKVKNRRLAGMRGEGARNAVPYQRLKTAMDYWCALWFWPLEQVDLLPSREEFLFDMTLILEGNILSSGADMFQKENLLSSADPNKVDLFDQGKSYGQVDIETLNEKSPRLRAVAEIVQRARFFHWPVELADLLLAREGFDLIVGNPPWIRPDWIDQDILAEWHPFLATRKMSAADIEDHKPQLLNNPNLREIYLAAYAGIGGNQAYLAAFQNYPLNEGGRPNFYKCFVERGFFLCKKTGFVGLLHPESHFLDPKAIEFRRACYRRLADHFQFSNELSDRMFKDVGHAIRKFSINIYRGCSTEPSFSNISNLYYPPTVDECFSHDGIGEIPGIKSDTGDWELRGHSDRIVHIDRAALSVVSDVMEGFKYGDVETTRFLAPHSKQTMNALRKIASDNRRFSNQMNNFFLSEMWNETTDTKKTKIIRRDPDFHKRLEDMVITGPNFFICNPLAKTPRADCSSKGDFDVIDLLDIVDNYMPRSNFTLNISKSIYHSKLPDIPWDIGKKHSDYYRLAFRRMVGSWSERTLCCAIIPKGVAHVNTVESISFEKNIDLVNAAGVFSSLPLDFLTKTSSVADIREAYIRNLPCPRLSDTALSRTLQLTSLTTWYSELWGEISPALSPDPWASDDRRLRLEGPQNCTPQWSRNCGLRTDFGRRQALVELDVLVAIALNLSLDEIIQMYRVQFPVLQSYDRDTWYDQNGRIVFTNSKNLFGVGLDRKIWEANKEMAKGTISKTFMDDTMPVGPIERTITYHAPFTLPNREEDYERAWSVFYPKYSSKAAA